MSDNGTARTDGTGQYPAMVSRCSVALELRGLPARQQERQMEKGKKITTQTHTYSYFFPTTVRNGKRKNEESGGSLLEACRGLW